MAIDLVKNIFALIETPIGTIDAEKLQEMVGLLRAELIEKAVLQRLYGDSELSNQIKEAQENLTKTKEELEGRIAILQKETEPIEFSEYEYDETLLPNINEVHKKRLQAKQREEQKANDDRRERIEKCVTCVEEQLQELEDLSVSMESVPQFIKNITNASKDDRWMQSIIDTFCPSICYGYDEIPSTAEGPLFEQTTYSRFAGLKPNFERILEYFNAVSDIDATKEARHYLWLDSEYEYIEKMIEEDETRIETAKTLLGLITPEGFEGAIKIVEDIESLKESPTLPAKPSTFMQRMISMFNKKRILQEQEQRKAERKQKIDENKTKLMEYDLDSMAAAVECRDQISKGRYIRSQDLRMRRDGTRRTFDDLRCYTNPKSIDGNSPTEKVENFLRLCRERKGYSYSHAQEDIECAIETLQKEVTSTKNNRDSIKKKIDKRPPLSDAAQNVINVLGQRDARYPIILRTEERYNLSPQAAFLGLVAIAGIHSEDPEIEDGIAKGINDFTEKVDIKVEKTREHIEYQTRIHTQRGKRIKGNIESDLDEI